MYVCSLCERAAPPSSLGRRLLKMSCFQRLAQCVCGYTLWQSLVLFGSCLKSTVRGSGRSLPDTSYSALLGSTVDTYACQSSVELLFPYSAQCLVLCGTCSASVTVLGKVVVPVLRNDRDMVRQCSKPCWCRICSLSKVVAFHSCRRCKSPWSCLFRIP